MTGASAKKVLLSAFLITAGYCAARHLINDKIPLRVKVPFTAEKQQEFDRMFEEGVAESRTLEFDGEGNAREVRSEKKLYHLLTREWSRENWLRRDTWKTVPRLAAFFLCLGVMWYFGGRALWGWHRGFDALGASALGGAVLLFYVKLFLGVSYEPFRGYEILTGVFSTLPVALMEEALFRGLFFAAMLRLLNPPRAAFWSSLIFAVYHFSAQPVSAWPTIFVWGFAACAAFHRGVGLPWLILAHYLTDVVYFFVPNQAAYREGMSALVVFVRFAYAALFLYSWLLLRSDGARLSREAGGRA